MRLLLPVTLCGALAVGIVGCEDRDNSSSRTTPPPATPPVEQTEIEASPQRTQAIDESRTMMDTLHDRWVQFKQSASETGQELKAETREAMEKADASWEQTKRDFDNWQQASGQAWDAAKAQFDKSYEHFKQAFTDARDSYDAHRVEPAPEPAPQPDATPQPDVLPPPAPEPAPTPIVPEDDAGR